MKAIQLIRSNSKQISSLMSMIIKSSLNPSTSRMFPNPELFQNPRLISPHPTECLQTTVVLEILVGLEPAKSLLWPLRKEKKAGPSR